MGVLNEAAIERAVKAVNELEKQLLAEQVKTNQWLAHIAGQLEQLIQVTQGQPRTFGGQPAPWQQVPR